MNQQLLQTEGLQREKRFNALYGDLRGKVPLT